MEILQRPILLYYFACNVGSVIMLRCVYTGKVFEDYRRSNLLYLVRFKQKYGKIFILLKGFIVNGLVNITLTTLQE